VISINGANPAHINIGDSYSDLGATITGPTQADTNLGIKTFLNGALVSNIVLDTTAAATDTIDYVATNAAGTSTSTRTVIIELPTVEAPPTQPTPPPPAGTSSTATSSAATTTTPTQ
jgi:spore maturation protein SpmA